MSSYIRKAVLGLGIGLALFCGPQAASAAAPGADCSWRTPESLVEELAQITFADTEAMNARRLAILTCLIEKDRSPSGWHKRRGDEYMRQQNYSAAILDYTVLIEFDSRQPKPSSVAYASRARAYLRNRQFDAAVRDYEQAILLDRVNPNYIMSQVGMCSVRARAYSLREALDACNVVLARRPDVEEVWLSLGIAYFRAGLFAEAEESFGKALVHGRGTTDTETGDDAVTAPALYGRGMARIRRGNTAAGKADVARARRFWPEGVAEIAQYVVE